MSSPSGEGLGLTRLARGVRSGREREGVGRTVLELRVVRGSLK